MYEKYNFMHSGKSDSFFYLLTPNTIQSSSTSEEKFVIHCDF